MTNKNSVPQKDSFIEKKKKATDWLRKSYHIDDISKLGENVALLLDIVWGLHHLNPTSTKKVDWSNDHCIDVVIGKPMATVDSPYLTKLVVIAHQMMIRVELEGAAPRYIRATFHQRRTRDRSDWFGWCPTIEDHVRMLKVDYLEEGQSND